MKTAIVIWLYYYPWGGFDFNSQEGCKMTDFIGE